MCGAEHSQLDGPPSTKSLIMEANNPYLAPTAPAANPVAGFSPEFSHLDDKTLKKLYHRSCNVSCIGALLGLASVGMISIATISGGNDSATEATLFSTPVFVALAVFYAVSTIGVMMRSTWGRIMGIITCSLSVLNIPLGTIIGIAGLFAFIKAPELFGQNRVTHKSLKQEFKNRKQAAKAAKQAGL